MEVHDSRRGGGCKVHKNAELFNKQHNFLEEIQELKKWKNLRNLELTSNVKKHDIKISLREKDNFVLKGFKDLESNAYKRKTQFSMSGFGDIIFKSVKDIEPVFREK